jgi:hypothetical protein
MQIKPYTRGEAIPAKPAAKPGPLAEGSGHSGPEDFADYADQPNAAGIPAAAPFAQSVPSTPPTYLQVLIQRIIKRRRLLVVWMLATAAVAFAVVKTFGRPTWKAEASLYYSPDYSYSNRRLYTPPNIQTMLSLIKSAEVVEKLRAEKGLDASVDTIQNRLTVSVMRQSDVITVSLEWPDRAQAEELADLILNLSIEQYEHLRAKLSKQALANLNESLRRTLDDEQTQRRKLSDSLSKRNIFDLKVEKDNIIREIAMLDLQIETAKSEKSSLENQMRAMDIQIKNLTAEMPKDGEAPLSESEIQLLRTLKETRERQAARQREVDQAKIKLRAKEDEYKRNLPLYQKGYISGQDWTLLTSEIATLKVTISGSKEVQEMDEEIKKLEKRIFDVKKGAATIPLQQARFDRLKLEVALEVMPKKIDDLKASLAERRTRQQFLLEVEKETMTDQQALDTLLIRRSQLTMQKQEHEKLEADLALMNQAKAADAPQSGELTVYSKASAGTAPSSTNHAKLVVAVFALSMLLFLGLIVVVDMPKALAAVPKAAPPESGWPLAVPVRRPMPPTTRGPQPETSSEHLRALAGRIAHGATERGAIVLFTPAAPRLRVETLMGDLGCYCSQMGGKVLIFDARPPEQRPAPPAWAGLKADLVARDVESYLDGLCDKPGSCFVPTLIAGIEYSRADLVGHLQGVMAMYRFRRLVHEMKERFAVVLMITPDRYRGGQGDVFATLAEGVVVVLTENADPKDVEDYLQDLRNSETPIYGAVTVPAS